MLGEDRQYGKDKQKEKRKEKKMKLNLIADDLETPI